MIGSSPSGRQQSPARHSVAFVDVFSRIVRSEAPSSSDEQPYAPKFSDCVLKTGRSASLGNFQPVRDTQILQWTLFQRTSCSVLSLCRRMAQIVPNRGRNASIPRLQPLRLPGFGLGRVVKHRFSIRPCAVQGCETSHICVALGFPGHNASTVIRFAVAGWSTSCLNAPGRL